MNKYHQQLDIRLLGNNITTVPRIVPGRMSTEDFVFFRWPNHFDPRHYDVVVQANDTAGAPWRSIGCLEKTVHLPEVHFGADSHIMVIPKSDDTKARFWSRLNRASTYEIPDLTCLHRREHQCEPNLYEMSRYGKITTSSVNSANLY